METNVEVNKHISVLLDESIEGLNIKKDGVYVDATLGRAGHSSKILEKLSSLGKLYAFDQDIQAVEASESILSTISPQFELIHDNFINIDKQLSQRKVQHVDGIIFDLGVSSPQLDDPIRGFSYHNDARLDMRMDQSQSLDAYEVVNTYSEVKLRQIILKYGEEKFAKSIAANIVKQRKQKPIETTLQLVEIIKKSFTNKQLRVAHPARRTFQAIRIEVNNELENLEIALRKAIELLNIQGRLVVITFHSLEDKIVKKIFKEVVEGEKWNKNMPLPITKTKQKYQLVNKKVILPSEDELKINYRSHSAKLRILEKL